MDKFFSIYPVGQSPFMITWDMGRRCNFDCSYCPSHRHDNFSPHASFEELKNTLDFIFSYIDTIASYRIDKTYCISFTGGEPTVNPNFIEFSKYLSKKKKQVNFNLTTDLTTNGAMSDKVAAAVIENFNHVTISYHAESHGSLKTQILDRIMQFKNNNINMKVNVMMHVDYFEECRRVCEFLEENKIKFIPRVIGENPDNNFSHLNSYTGEHKSWFKKYYGVDASPDVRPCCGGRTMGLCSNNGIVQSKTVGFREFAGWSCSVNWYFLHVEQQTKLIYTHQTCQARLDGTRGPIGTLDNWEDMVKNLSTNLKEKTMPIIVCPNKLCGCGLCTPKSKNGQELKNILPMVLSDTSIFN